MRVEVVRAWPRRHEAVSVELPEAACVAEALAAAGFDLNGISGYAVFGERVPPEAVLHEGDRVELLRPLLADPKDARRRRAQQIKKS